MDAYRVVDLFAGIGGIRLGFEQAARERGIPVETVFASEWCSFAQKTYTANYGVCPQGDITKIEASEIPEFDVLLAGFPCQPFSFMGKRKGFEDVRGTLFYDIARIVAHHKPLVLLLENVRGLVLHNKGQTFRVILQVLRDLGYTVHFEVLDACEFGVPQKRARVYIVCFNTSKLESLGHTVSPHGNVKDTLFDIGDSFAYEFPKPTYAKTRVGDILEPEVHSKYTMSDHTWTYTQRRKERMVEKGNCFGFLLNNEETPFTSTLLARYSSSYEVILIDQSHKGMNPRRLTPREVARLQGYPDTFSIVASDSQAYRQFGNSVCVPVVKVVAQQIFKALHGWMCPKKNN